MHHSLGSRRLLLCIYLIVQFSSSTRISIARALAGRGQAEIASPTSIATHESGIVLDSKRFEKWLREHGTLLRWDPYATESQKMSIAEYLYQRFPEETVDEIVGLKIFFGPPPELQPLRVEVIGPNLKCEEIDVTVSDLREGDYFRRVGVEVWSRFGGVKGTQMIFLSPKYTGRIKTFVAGSASEDMTSDLLVKKADCSKDATVDDIFKFMYPSIRHHFRGFDSIPNTFMVAMSEIMALHQDKVMAAVHENVSMTNAAQSSSLLEEKAATQAIVLSGQDFKTNCLAHPLLRWDALKKYLSTQFIKPTNIAKVEGLVLLFDIPKASNEAPSTRHAKVNPDSPTHDSRSPRLSSTTLLGPVRLCKEIEVDASSLLVGDYYTLSLSNGPWARVVSQDPLKSLQPMTSRDMYGKWHIDPVIQAISSGHLESFTFDEGKEVTKASLSFSALGFMKRFFIDFAPQLGTTKVWKASCSKGATLDEIWDFVYPSARRQFENMGVIPPSFKDVMLTIMETPVADLPELADEVRQEIADFEAARHEYTEAQAKIAAQRQTREAKPRGKVETDVERERVLKIISEKETRRMQEKSRNRFWRFGSFMRSPTCTSCAECKKCHRCKGRWCSPTSFKCYDAPTRSKYLDCQNL